MDRQVYLPADFYCSEAIRQQATEKLGRLEAIAADLPFFILHDLRDFSIVYVAERGLPLLGASLAEIRRQGRQCYERLFQESESESTLSEIFECINQTVDEEKWLSDFRRVTRGSALNMKWYLSATRLFLRDERGEPLLSFSFALPLDPDHHLSEKAGRLMAENVLLKANYERFLSLTKREKELLRYMASGHTAAEMGAAMHLAEGTIHTHRRNIKRKLGARSHYDLVQLAQVFNVI